MWTTWPHHSRLTTYGAPRVGNENSAEAQVLTAKWYFGYWIHHSYGRVLIKRNVLDCICLHFKIWFVSACFWAEESCNTSLHILLIILVVIIVSLKAWTTITFWFVIIIIIYWRPPFTNTNIFPNKVNFVNPNKPRQTSTLTDWAYVTFICA